MKSKEIMDQDVVLIKAASLEDICYFGLNIYKFLLGKQVPRILKEPLPE